jgi:AcrR family transcriptional regulator
MSGTSMPADERRRELLEALRRVKKALQPGERLSILRVAEEAGVSGSLIHNRYPDIADKILGKTRRQRSEIQLDRLQKDLAAAMEAIADLRKQLKAESANVRRLASINLTLTMERDDLKALISAPNVTPLRKR